MLKALVSAYGHGLQSRRMLLQAGAFGLVLPLWSGHPAQIRNNAVTLLSAPIELIGNWGHMIPGAAAKIVERTRHARLDEVSLVSDHQPTGLRVDEHTSGNPAVWLHFDGRDGCPSMRRAASARAHAQTRPVLAAIAGLLIAMALLPTVSPSQAETMSSALARTYAGNPDLNQQRAGVRATDENLPRATAAWRPTASATGQYGYNYFDLTAPAASRSAFVGAAAGAPITTGTTRLRQATDPGALGLTVTQNLFNGNRTVNGVKT